MSRIPISNAISYFLKLGEEYEKFPNYINNTITVCKGEKTIRAIGNSNLGMYSTLHSCGDDDTMLLPLDLVIHYGLDKTNLYGLMEDGRYCWIDGYVNLKHLLEYWQLSDVSRKVLIEKIGYIL